MIRVHCQQHADFEGPANIELWAKQNGHAMSRTLIFFRKVFPFHQRFWLARDPGRPDGRRR